MDPSLLRKMASGLVGLPMYDAPEIRAANRLFWRAIATTLTDYGVKDLPQDLTTPDHLPRFWSDAGLIFGQTCGYPLTHDLCGQAMIIATPCYNIEQADGPRYGSAIIVAHSSSIRSLTDAKNCVAAINGDRKSTRLNSSH